ncbi:uncharacterized protein ACR2FA_000470 isoform 1-T1 [Aphomia sociella]
MSEYYHIVPWYNTEEWHRVYNEIFIKANKENALNLLQIWKARCPLLPSGVESTFILLQVQVQDVKSSANTAHDQFLRLAYSAAVMRFVNHMLDAETSKGVSLYHAAKNLGVPDWIIDLRHDTAHSNNLPSIELLRDASVIGLNWLRTSYWDKYKECIEDYITGQIDKSSSDETQIATLVHFCISLSICTHHKSNIKKLSQIPEADMRESIICDVRDLFGHLIDLSNMKTVSIMSLVNVMNAHCKKILRGKDTAVYVNKILLDDDSIFLSLDLVQYLCENDFDRKNLLSESYVKCFELLLTFLHTNELLLEFILELIHITKSNNNNENKCRLAAIWVSEILRALRRSKDFVERIKKNATDIQSKKRKELKSLYQHWFPNEDRNCLLLDLQKSPPSQLLDLNFVKPIISEYNPYLKYFITDILHLVEPQIQKSIKTKILNLANLISSPEKSISSTLKIYTVDDLKQENKGSINVIKPYAEPNDWNQTLDTEMVNQESQEPSKVGIWKLSTKEINWSTCPIGQIF